MKTIQSVERAISILKKLGGLDDGISVTDLSNALDLDISTTHRYLYTLKNKNIVTQDNSTLKYSLGIGFLEIALSYLGTLDLKKAADPAMSNLHEVTGETVNLAVIDKLEVIYIERIESKQDFRHSISIGKRAPACTTSLGKAILAFMDIDAVSELLSKNPIVKTTRFSKDNPKDILKDLKKIRKTKIAIDDREHQEHIRCVGSPIFDMRGNVIAAVSVSGPVSRVTDEKLDLLKKEVKKTAQAISENLGWLDSINK